jgi:hypothetical protein
VDDRAAALSCFNGRSDAIAHDHGKAEAHGQRGEDTNLQGPGRGVRLLATRSGDQGHRGFFELADIAQNARRGRSATAISPIALEAVRRIDQLFEIEREIHGLSPEERLRVRQERSAPLLSDLEAWLRAECARLSRSSNVIKPINYLLNRWEGFARFIHDGRMCMTNNAAERALRGFALGRRSWLFAGSDRGAERAAVMATLIMTASLNNIDPKAWLADVLARIAEMPQSRLHELLPWNWTPTTSTSSAQAA